MIWAVHGGEEPSLDLSTEVACKRSDDDVAYWIETSRLFNGFVGNWIRDFLEFSIGISLEKNKIE